MTCIFVFLWFTLMILSINHCDSCIDLNGIGEGESNVYTLADLSTFYDPGAVVNGLGITDFVTGVTREYETAVSIQLATYGTITYYNVLSYYQVTAVEFFGRRDISQARRFCQPDETDSNQTDLFNLHQLVALAYVIYYQFRDRYPSAVDFYKENFMSPRGLNATLCDEFKYSSDSGNGNNNESYIDAFGCLDSSTPWGLANIVCNEILLFTENDGWNTYGSYSREYNRIPYSDFRNDDTRYVPKNTPWVLENSDHWQPLLESDDLGFLYYHEHSVPHAGYTAKSFLFDNDEFCERSSNFQKNFGPDDYDYEIEMELAINKLRDLTEIQKMEIEYFDNKLTSLVPFFNQIVTRIGILADSFESVASGLMEFLSFYEATIAVWKEKVDFDRIRPNTAIQNLLSGVEITR